MPTAKPKDLGELFAFYLEYVKPLYSAIQLENHLPVEVIFELNAALDHVSRHFTYGEEEQKVVEKAYSHLKRTCLDIFKLTVKKATDQYRELKELDTHLIDNGAYDQALNVLYSKIKREATEARVKEGDTRQDNVAVSAFDLWEPVYLDCVTLQKKFYEHSHVNWGHKTAEAARVKNARTERWWGFWIGIGTGLLTFFVTASLWDAAALYHWWKPNHPTVMTGEKQPPSVTATTTP